jgi:hypothetical protein
MTGDYTHASPEEMERAMELVASYEARDFSNLVRISAKEKTASDAQPSLAL